MCKEPLNIDESMKSNKICTRRIEFMYGRHLRVLRTFHHIIEPWEVKYGFSVSVGHASIYFPIFKVFLV